MRSSRSLVAPEQEAKGGLAIRWRGSSLLSLSLAKLSLAAVAACVLGDGGAGHSSFIPMEGVPCTRSPRKWRAQVWVEQGG